LCYQYDYRKTENGKMENGLLSSPFLGYGHFKFSLECVSTQAVGLGTAINPVQVLPRGRSPIVLADH